jgi:putative transposase
MVEWKTDALSVRRQCELLGLHRSTAYYQPVPVSSEELQLMRLLDEQYLKTPFYGSRRMTQWLRAKGHKVNRKRVQRLMRQMGLEGLAPGPSTSRPHPEHVKYPYLLTGLAIERANLVWAADITYIPMAQGFAYLVAILDWFSRFVLAYRLSNTLDVAFCVEALEESMRRFGCPGIFNTDQGSQFTAEDFTRVLLEKGVRISMDGKGRCRDNIFVERLWRSLKYEEVYLHAYEDMRQAHLGIARWMGFYNEERPHQALGYRTPGAVYRESIASHPVAA